MLRIIFFLLFSLSQTSLLAKVYCPHRDMICLSHRTKALEFGNLSILQGHTTETSAQINILLPKRANKVLFEVINENGDAFKNIQVKEFTLPRVEWKAQTLLIKNLRPDSKYQLNIKDKKKRVIDSRFFSTVNENLENIKIAIASCMNDTKSALERTMWNSLIKTDPDMILLIGDNVYADYPTAYTNHDERSKNLLFYRYVETRLKLTLFRQQYLKPIYAIWDDHDYGANNSGKWFSKKKLALEIFKGLYAQSPDKFIKKGPGASYVLKKKNFNQVFLDNRSFRDGRGNRNGAHIGKKQLNWIKKMQLKMPSFFIQGDQFFGAYHRFESYERLHPKEFQRFNKLIKSLNIPIVYVSGDRHLYELMKIENDILGYETYEITSSGIHSSTRRGEHKQFPNPRRIDGIDDKNTFVTLTLKNNKYPFEDIDLHVYGKDETPLSQQHLIINKRNLD